MRFDLAPRSFRPHGYGASGKISKPLLYRCRLSVNIIDRIISTGWGNFLSKNVVSFEHSRQGGVFSSMLYDLAAKIILPHLQPGLFMNFSAHSSYLSA
jgi:hypothetical protein